MRKKSPTGGSTRPRGAVLAGLILLCAGPATAQELDKGWEPMGAEAVYLKSGISAQLMTGSRLSGEKYADGPSLGKSDAMGEDYLLKGLAADEIYVYPQVPTNLWKTKKKRAEASTRIDY